nr:hypothetical protein [Actinomycetota bacterium]
YSNLGQPRRAVELFERCLAEVRAQEPADAASEVRYATYLSYALTDAGELEGGRAPARRAGRALARGGRPYTRVRLYWSLGRLATREGQALSGLAYFRRAVALLEATEDTLHLARAHLSCAWALTKSGRAEEAGRHLELAEQLFWPKLESADLGWLRTEQAKRALKLGRAEEALAALGTSDPGELERADPAFRQALELLAGHRPARDCAAAYRAWAKLLRQADRETEALDALEQAAELGSLLRRCAAVAESGAAGEWVPLLSTRRAGQSAGPASVLCLTSHRRSLRPE